MRRNPAWYVALVFVLETPASPVIADQTITTSYRYNADGALTATTVQTNGGVPATAYFAYDNFTPDAADPSSGAVSAGDGNLLAVGASPGAADNAGFAYDARDRLIGCRTGSGAAVGYGYDASSLLADATLPSGDELQFYFGPQAAMTNVRQPATATAAGFLDRTRYLSTGGPEQALLAPRKDIAAIYEPEQQSLEPYGYDPYGAPRTPPPTNAGLSPDGQSWDLTYNPFQYTGAYLDPVCGAYYLQHRWYWPAQQTFLTRDPADAVHHYGYTGGNPIGRVDPTGLSYRSYQAGVDRFLKKLSFGNTVLSVLPVTGEAMFLLQATAMGEFWHNTRASVMLGLGALAIGAEGLRDLSGPLANVDRSIGHRLAFFLRSATDVVIGGGQAVAGTYNGRHWRIEPSAFGGTIGTAVGTMFVGRIVLGIGYRPFTLSAADVGRMVDEHFANPTYDSMMVFRTRKRILGGGTSPLLETLHMAMQHDALVGYSSTRAVTSELDFMDDDDPSSIAVLTRWAPRDFRGVAYMSDQHQAIFVDHYARWRVEDVVGVDRNPQYRNSAFGRAWKQWPDYSLRNNCQHHVAQLLKELAN